MKKVKIINYLINPINLNLFLKIILQWNKNKKSNYVCISNVHSCIESFKDKRFKQAHNSADLALADGRPIYWALKLSRVKKCRTLTWLLCNGKNMSSWQTKRKSRLVFMGLLMKI